MEWNEFLDKKPTALFSQAIGKRKELGKEIVSMGLGEPDLKTPQYIVESMFKAIEDGYTTYSSSQGLLELRKYIAEDLSKRVKVNYSPEEVVILPGIKAAIYFSLCSILSPNDEVIYCTPCYVSYPSQIMLAEPRAKLVPLSLKGEDFRFDIEEFKNCITPNTKVLLLANPNNPTGNVYSKETIEEIIQICLQNNIYIISDEVYDKLLFNSDEFITFSNYQEIKENLIIVNGYSKSHAMTGWRLGYAIANKELVRKMSILNFNVNTNTTTFIQKAACSIYQHEWSHLDDYREKLNVRMNYFHSKVNGSDILSGFLPEAGFFYFVNIEKTGLTSNEFCARLVLEKGVAATPGIAFGDDWDHYVRFSLAVPFETIEYATESLLSFLEGLEVG